MKATFIKSRDALLPCGEDAQELLKSIKSGDQVLVDIHQGRSGKNHRRFFAFVRETFNWQEQYENEEIWRGILLILGGHYITVVDKKGNTQFWPRSISFAELDDEKVFQDLFNRVIQAYINKYGKSLSNEQLTMVVQF